MSTHPSSGTSTVTVERPPKVLCAYSPRWLSGPTPGYQGLCATWTVDTTDTQHTAN